MDNTSKGEPWGKLVKLDSNAEPEVLLINRECTVGRRKGCDLSFPTNKLVSGDHCKITQDEESGEAWLEDTSTNGTVINMSKLVKKQMHLLQSGDVIYFVYRKNEPVLNIAYVYHSLKPKPAGSQPPRGESLTEGETEGRKEDPAVEVSPASPSLEQHPVHEEPQPSTSSTQIYSTSTPTPHPRTVSSGPETELSVTSQNPPEGGAGGPDTKPFCLKQLLMDRESAATEESEPERKKRKTHADEPRETGSGAIESSEGDAKGSVVGMEGKTKPDGVKTDKMEESLTCIICQDLLYDCVSLQPCMHTFCAACYSGWMERSSLCPTCRCPVERIRKNHILNNLVEAYLLQHPEKCRSEEDLKSMDMRNKITQDMLQPRVDRSFSDEEGSSDYLFELSDNDSDTSDTSQPYLLCRQCPGYRKDSSSALWICGPAPEDMMTKTPGDAPSTSTHTDTAAQTQAFKCLPQGSHIICTCCLQPMPDRRAEVTGQQISSQHCMVCQRPFCHMYWGCQRIGCQGCLAPFSELNLTDKCLDGVLNGNNYESEILQNYLASRGLSWKQMLLEGLRGVQQGTLHLSDCRINSNAVLCYCCGLRAFKELAYKYRENIPASDLPAAVTSRPDCYWGRNCRTQVKAHHAMKFNHICEQTRFKN
ncbi:E3 ubiquitin-protein ligase CHFR [Chanos chanos]|uniref:E3 ubiquitin-protein ligase CHFR n=1 Tax=Chanos chanos TaxID=29144 RepID=A0A6J2WTL3_CHACN|nr:E3 ubiquitin-protein ligase CHFR [Chanos chanos]